jgi:hypothetical protein
MNAFLCVVVVGAGNNLVARYLPLGRSNNHSGGRRDLRGVATADLWHVSGDNADRVGPTALVAQQLLCIPTTCLTPGDWWLSGEGWAGHDGGAESVAGSGAGGSAGAHAG